MLHKDLAQNPQWLGADENPELCAEMFEKGKVPSVEDFKKDVGVAVYSELPSGHTKTLLRGLQVCLLTVFLQQQREPEPVLLQGFKKRLDVYDLGAYAINQAYIDKTNPAERKAIPFHWCFFSFSCFFVFFLCITLSVW